MKIRRFHPSDLKALLQLFYDTVHTINSKDYSSEQIKAWAPENPDVERWGTSLAHNITYVAEINNRIVGFADLTALGELDRLYTHKDYQGKGIGSQLLHTLEAEARKLHLKSISTESSITAKPFFERHGYEVLKIQQKKHRSGLTFLNFIMYKKL